MFYGGGFDCSFIDAWLVPFHYQGHVRVFFLGRRKWLLPESLLPNYLRPIMEQSFLLMMTVIGSPFLAPSATVATTTLQSIY